MRRGSCLRVALLALLCCALSVAALADTYTTLRYLDNGNAVLLLQQALNILGYSTGGMDGKFGPATLDAVEQFQRNNGLKVDGIAGSATQTLLYQPTGGSSASPAPDTGSSSSGSSSNGLFSGNYTTLKYGSRGDRVSILQKALNDLGFNAGSVDGSFGAGTQKAVTAFQKSAGLKQDGLAGRDTLTALEKPFYGVYYGQAALPMESETLYYLDSDLLRQCSVYDYETGKTGSVYDLSKLESRDLYDIFLSGARSLLTIENPNATSDRELIVFRDSFGSSMVPLLVQDYAKVTLVDIRYIHPDLLAEYIDFHGQDVLMLYSTLILNNSAALR